jgi:hypothetical protein
MLQPRDALVVLAVIVTAFPRVRGAHALPARQPPLLLVRVMDDASRRPVLNAEVIDQASGQHRFTNERGEVRLAWPGDGQLQLRARQVGYRFVDRLIRRVVDGARQTDTAAFSLVRISYTLPEVFARTGCSETSDSVSRSLSVSVLEQLRASAERYEAFRKAYPFKVKVERRTALVAGERLLGPIRRSIEEADSDEWGDPYLPGHVVDQNARGFSVPILFVAALANPAFWDHHCFVARGIETMHGERLLRLQFSPSQSDRTVDWAGSALIDSATSLLRRVEFQLAGLRQDESPNRFEGYTTFMSPSPDIVVPDSTVAIWWRHGAGPDGRWGAPDRAVSLHVLEMKYRKSTPPLTGR